MSRHEDPSFDKSVLRYDDDDDDDDDTTGTSPVTIMLMAIPMLIGEMHIHI